MPVNLKKRGRLIRRLNPACEFAADGRISLLIDWAAVEVPWACPGRTGR